MRFLLAVLIALLVNGALFAMLEGLTRSPQNPALVAPNQPLSLHLVQIESPPSAAVAAKQEPQTRTTRGSPQPPAPLQGPAPNPLRPEALDPMPAEPRFPVVLRVDSPPFIGNIRRESVAPALEQEITPLVRVNPRYPPRARRAGIEGWVTVQFTIERDGRVVEPEVLESRPAGVFDRQVLSAIQRWRFSPKVENGETVARVATQTIRFQLRGSEP